MKNGFYEDRFGTQCWYLNDELHREDGPAVIEIDGYQEWWINGKLHREDGPAYIDNNDVQLWYVNDIHITIEVEQWFEEFKLTYETLEFEDEMALKFFIRGLAT